MRYLVAGIILTVATFVLGTGGYLLISSLTGYAFGGLFRMFMYHEAHPFQYIAIVAVGFGFFGSLWLRFFGSAVGIRRWGSILAAIGITILASSIPGGVLWVIHDMQAGYFTTGARFWGDIWWGATEGLKLGWLVIAVSVPYNLLGLALGVMCLHNLPRLVATITTRDEQDVAVQPAAAADLKSE